MLTVLWLIEKQALFAISELVEKSRQDFTIIVQVFAVERREIKCNINYYLFRLISSNKHRHVIAARRKKLLI